ncbi:MAG TPA: type II toxin-antitoxin system VapC family toxin [Candidatus Nanoarchaeia archaeon]|nr:type II toxin-antitoxin system VapC family toxin [Candidatus Nanoarchaeia archaeon]
MALLDTDILVNFLRNEETTVQLVRKLQEKSQLATTTINEFELWKGVYKSKKEEENKELQNLLSELQIKSFDSRASKKAAFIFEELKSKGEMVDALDVMIAAIAISQNERLVTFNKKHFERIRGLQLAETQ